MYYIITHEPALSRSYRPASHGCSFVNGARKVICLLRSRIPFLLRSLYHFPQNASIRYSFVYLQNAVVLVSFHLYSKTQESV